MESIYNFVRTKVSGKRNRTKEDGYDLDLTYITPRILAMSFPAQAFIQKIYRNNIDHVAKYLEEKHDGKYMIYNLSGTKYDITPFKYRVNHYDWEDHHSPTLVLLHEAC
jgi:phosphatidylinositol-3,4,5-trisphosphate 3-phosphatase and dual-specificity protein phosphatase PTEN